MGTHNKKGTENKGTLEMFCLLTRYNMRKYVCRYVFCLRPSKNEVFRPDIVLSD